MSARMEVEVLGRRAGLSTSEASEVAGRIIAAAHREVADELEKRGYHIPSDLVRRMTAGGESR